MKNEIACYRPNSEELKLLRGTLAKDLNEPEFNLFMAVCKATGLNPIMKQIYPIKYKSIVTYQVGIDGLRLQAQRSGKYRGQIGPYWCGVDGIWQDTWLSDDFPVAAKVAVYHAEMKNVDGEYLPIWGIAKFSNFAKYSLAANGQKKLYETWAHMPDLMIAKCAEAQAIRKAFPQETSKLYIKEELLTPESMQRLEEQNAMDAEIGGKPEVKIPEKNITPAVAQIKEMLDDMNATRPMRDKFIAMLKKQGEEQTLNAVADEYTLFLDEASKNAGK